MHSYRARWDEAPPDPRSQWLEDEVRATPTLSLPALYFQGEVDGINPPSTSRSVPGKFTGSFELVTLAGVGHFPQREAPAEVAAKLVAHFKTAIDT